LGTGVYKNIRELVVNIELYGYYSGIRLVKAAIKKFFDHFQNQSI